MGKCWEEWGWVKLPSTVSCTVSVCVFDNQVRLSRMDVGYISLNSEERHGLEGESGDIDVIQGQGAREPAGETEEMGWLAVGGP